MMFYMMFVLGAFVGAQAEMSEHDDGSVWQ